MCREDIPVSIHTLVPVFTHPHMPAQTFNVWKHTYKAFLSLGAEWFPGSTHKSLWFCLRLAHGVFGHKDQILAYREQPTRSSHQGLRDEMQQVSISNNGR